MNDGLELSKMLKRRLKRKNPSTGPGSQENRTRRASDHPDGSGRNEKLWQSFWVVAVARFTELCIAPIGSDVTTPRPHPRAPPNDHAADGIDRAVVALEALVVRGRGDMARSVVGGSGCVRGYSAQRRRSGMVSFM